VTSDQTPRIGHSASPPNAGTASASAAHITPASATEVQYDVGRQEIICSAPLPVRRGDWVVMTVAGGAAVHHRVEDNSLYPTVKLSDVGVTQKSASASSLGVADVPATPAATPATTPPPNMLVAAIMTKYDQMFDDMDDVGKAESIVMILDTLPTIKELRSYLVHQGRSAEPSLRTWKERVSPAALGILRWIIASNRSCIVQVDVCPGQTESEVAKAKIRLDQKCSNVDESYVQFRFAQGAPDKEQRFLNALKAQEANLNPRYPTMFAWHGSPLANWHSIIRHGLDFRETHHGRAYGHGVYHAQDQNISLGYARTSNVVSYTIQPFSEMDIHMLTIIHSLIGLALRSQSIQL
jgi:ubiquitin-conjugating enzyme E2 Q